MVVEIEHSTAGMIKLTGVPTKLSLTPGAVSEAPPTLGQHTDQILTELGYTEKEISDLHQQGIV
jgi:crotonobetainyl-CoA:carnitine CoA-transferase CaiB-like acyl-CoA transferase